MADRKTYTAEDFKGCNGRRVLAEVYICDDEPEAEGGIFVGGAPDADFEDRALIPHSAIVEILPEEIGVGDRVQRGNSYTGRVEHIFNGRAWVAEDSGLNCFPPVSALTLVERAG